MNNLITGTKCDLCGNKTTDLTCPSTILDHIEDLEYMCYPCNDKLTVAFTEVRKVVSKLIAEALSDAVDEIRAGASKPIGVHPPVKIYQKSDGIKK